MTAIESRSSVAGVGLVIPPHNAFRLALLVSNTAFHVTFSAQVLGSDGVVRLAQATIRPTTAFSLETSTVPAPEGVLLSAIVQHDQTSDIRGDVFARLSLFTTPSTTGNEWSVVVQGYVGLFAPLSWPGGVMEPAGVDDTAGLQFQFTNPGAGNDLAGILDGVGFSIVYGCGLMFVTDATVITRTMSWRLGLGVIVSLSLTDSTTQTAGQTRFYEAWNWGAAPATITSVNRFLLPAVAMAPGNTMATEIDNLQAGDVVSNAWVFGRRYMGLAL